MSDIKFCFLKQKKFQLKTTKTLKTGVETKVIIHVTNENSVC